MFEKNKKYIIILAVSVIFVISSIGIFLKIEKANNKNDNSNKQGESIEDTEKKEYEVLVFVRNQSNSNPEEDRRSSMKKGYVIGVYNNEHNWSNAEKTSYLILKMNLTNKEKTMLVQPVEKEIQKKDLSEEDQKMLEDEGQEVKKETVGMRAYKINLEKIGFDNPKQLVKGQPFEEQSFGWEIVEKVK